MTRILQSNSHSQPTNVTRKKAESESQAESCKFTFSRNRLLAESYKITTFGVETEIRSTCKKQRSTITNKYMQPTEASNHHCTLHTLQQQWTLSCTGLQKSHEHSHSLIQGPWHRHPASRCHHWKHIQPPLLYYSKPTLTSQPYPSPQVEWLPMLRIHWELHMWHSVNVLTRNCKCVSLLQSGGSRRSAYGLLRCHTSTLQLYLLHFCGLLRTG